MAPTTPFPAGAGSSSDFPWAKFGIDVKSGFMPSEEPVSRLNGDFELWENTLDKSLGTLKLANDSSASEKDRAFAEKWRVDVGTMPVLSVEPLIHDEPQLRRAHVVLTFLMHSFVHCTEHDPAKPIVIPRNLALPLVRVSHELGIRPVLVYADLVLWNWKKTDAALPFSSSNISCHTNLSGTSDENHFNMTSAWIELRGVEAISLMRLITEEITSAKSEKDLVISTHLRRLSVVIDELTSLLMAERDACDPAVFFHLIRPWFNGGNAHPSGWLYEGVDDVEEARTYSTLGGPTAGQSSLIHALDIFLGVDHHLEGTPSKSEDTFLERQKQYMPIQHRAFLAYLGTINNPIRSIALSPKSNDDLKGAYNGAVDALKRFRDGHIRIATLYIITQARQAQRAKDASREALAGNSDVADGIRGSGGTLLVPFLKAARDNTIRSRLE